MPERGAYVSLSLPIELIAEVRRLPLRQLGYRSLTEFVKEAVRKRIEERQHEQVLEAPARRRAR